MFRLALKMLFGDTLKYTMLVFGLFFASFLMTQQTAVFCGLMRWTTSTLRNVPAPIWVVEAKVEQVNETNPMRDTDVARVRSVDSVAWAAPIYSGVQRVRLSNGAFKTIQLVGIDPTTLAGAPPHMLQGRLEDLRLPNTVIIDDLAVERLELQPGKPIKVGDLFEINDLEARVVGIAGARRSFTGGPYVWTTYERALQYSPSARKMLCAAIAAPKPGISPDQAAADIEKCTGMRAFVNKDFMLGAAGANEFNTSTIWWYVRNTGIPVSFGITVLVGLIVGIAIACQTFSHSFVAENMKHLGALKAMGASNGTLCLMLILQSLTVGVVGYGMGMLMTAGVAFGALARQQPPFYLPWIILPINFLIIIGICMLAALLGIWRVSRYEPAMVFRD